MKSADLVPDAISYSTLVNKSRDYETAKKHFDEMKSAELVPDAISYSTLVNKSRDYETAKFHFDQMKKKSKPNTITFNTLLKKASWENRFKETLVHLEEMYAFGLRPQSYPDKRNRGQMFHATANAVQDTVRHNKSAFEEWVAQKAWKNRFWEEFFRQF